MGKNGALLMFEVVVLKALIPEENYSFLAELLRSGHPIPGNTPDFETLTLVGLVIR